MSVLRMTAVGRSLAKIFFQYCCQAAGTDSEKTGQ